MNKHALVDVYWHNDGSEWIRKRIILLNWFKRFDSLGDSKTTTAGKGSQKLAFNKKNPLVENNLIIILKYKRVLQVKLQVCTPKLWTNVILVI